MTNDEIITRAAIAAGIITPEEAAECIKKTGRVPVHTFGEWRAMGYRVRAGEHAALAVTLWKQVKAKKDDDEKPAGEHMIRSMAYLFSAAQIEKIEPAKVKTADEIKAYNAMLAAQRKARSLQTA